MYSFQKCDYRGIRQKQMNLDADPPFVIKIQGGQRALLKNFNVSMLIKPCNVHFVENFLETP